MFCFGYLACGFEFCILIFVVFDVVGLGVCGLAVGWFGLLAEFLIWVAHLFAVVGFVLELMFYL